MDIAAGSDMGLQIVAGGGGLSESVGVGAAVAINDITNTTTAFIAGNADVDATGGLSVSADASVNPLPVDIKVTSVDLTSIAAGAGVSSGDAGVAGSAVINLFDLDTHAYIAGGALINQDVTGLSSQDVLVHASDVTKVRSGAGTLGVGLDGAGVGAGLDLAIIDKDTRAYVGSGAQVKAKGSVAIEATSSEDIVSVATNIGGGSSAGIAGSASVQIITTGTIAYVEDTAGTAASVVAGG